ncbi:hypothetical protein AB0I77_10475 [Streptomyces sp. NPDC050619]|uniref:hypothetical protein n=1 Tax=Streptomyces sp. NPDC050619 TaxID=3157214 RepID=UPI00344737A2
MDHNAPGRPGRGRPVRGTARMRAGLGVAAVLAVAGPSLMPTAAEAGPAVPAPATQWSTQTLAPGVQVRTGPIRHADVTPTWTVAVQSPGVSRLTGAPTWSEVGTRSWADTTARKLRDAGFQPRVESVRWPRYADTPHGVMGLRVRIGAPHRPTPGPRRRRSPRPGSAPPSPGPGTTSSSRPTGRTSMSR